MLLSVNMPPEEPLLLIKRPTRSVVYIILVESGASEQLHLPQDPSLTMQAIEKQSVHVGSVDGLAWKRIITKPVPSAVIRF